MHVVFTMLYALAVLIGSVGYNVNEISGVGDVSVVQIIASYHDNYNYHFLRLHARNLTFTRS